MGTMSSLKKNSEAVPSARFMRAVGRDSMQSLQLKKAEASFTLSAKTPIHFGNGAICRFWIPRQLDYDCGR